MKPGARTSISIATRGMVPSALWNGVDPLPGSTTTWEIGGAGPGAQTLILRPPTMPRETLALELESRLDALTSEPCDADDPCAETNDGGDPGTPDPDTSNGANLPPGARLPPNPNGSGGPLDGAGTLQERLSAIEAAINGASISAVCNGDSTITVTLTFGGF